MSPDIRDAAASRADELDADRVGLHYKGLAPTLPDDSVGHLVRRRPALVEAGFNFPLLVLSRSALEHNATAMSQFCRRHGVQLAPHGKTTMSPELHALQVREGAWGLTAATIHQVGVYRRFGVSRIILANELVDEAALLWVARELERDPGFTLYCFVDSVEGVELMGHALREATGQPPRALVEVGYPGGRAGCRDLGTVRAVAQSVVAEPGLSLAGVGGYEGLIGHDRDPATVQAVTSFVRFVRDAAETVLDSPGSAAPGDFVVTCGGSAYFDIVVDELVHRWTRAAETTTVLRSGSYLTHDDGLYESVSPLIRAGTGALRPALHVWAHVLSTPEPRRAIVGAGRRDVPFDSGLPRPQLVWRRGEVRPSPLPGAGTTDINDHHLYLDLQGDDAQVGDLVGFGISHPCTAFDKWRLIPVVDDDWRIVDCVHTYF